MTKPEELKEGDRVIDFEGERGTVMSVRKVSKEEPEYHCGKIEIKVQLDNDDEGPWYYFTRSLLRKLPNRPNKVRTKRESGGAK